MKKILVALGIMLMGTFAAPAANNCTDATYYDADTDSCINCPTGYDYNTATGKTAITQCQINCPAGKYVAPLPTGYTRLEYLENTGAQWITTNIPWSSVARFRGKAQQSATNTLNRAVLGSTTLNSDPRALWGTAYLTSGSTYWYWSTGISPLTIANFDIHRNATYGWSGTVNGIVTNSSNTPYFATDNVMIMGQQTGGADSTYYNRAFNGFIWYIQLFDSNNNLLFNGIPARRNSDNVLGMYDTVSGTFFTNAGTGTFVAGPDVGCVTCSENSYCAGGVYNFTGTAQGINACPAGLYSPAGMWAANQCGHILHIGDEIVYLHGVKKTSPSLHVKIGNDIFYGNMTTADVVMHAGTSHKLKVQYNNATYSIYDDTVAGEN